MGLPLGDLIFCLSHPRTAVPELRDCIEEGSFLEGLPGPGRNKLVVAH